MAKLKLPLKDFQWSSELAYAVGLLVTDGNMSSDGRHINFRSNDLDLINTFKKCLKIDNKPGVSINKGTQKNISYRIQFGNVQFYNWLLKIGLSPKKSYVIGKIDIPDIYFRDFLRGHLDGDGTILYYIDRYGNYRGRKYKNSRLYVCFTSASGRHMRWLYNKIIEVANVKGALLKNRPYTANRVPMWVIKIAKRESLKLLNWIYYENNIPTLWRKQKIAIKAINSIDKENRKPYKRIGA